MSLELGRTRMFDVVISHVIHSDKRIVLPKEDQALREIGLESKFYQLQVCDPLYVLHCTVLYCTAQCYMYVFVLCALSGVHCHVELIGSWLCLCHRADA